MPYIAVVTPQIPPADKDEFLAAWPSVKADIAKQPGVLDVGGGEVIDENFAPVSDFKFFQTISFASPDEEKAFGDSAWTKDHVEKAMAKMAGPPMVRKFVTGDYPAAVPKALTQFSFIELADEGKHEEAKQAWVDLEAAIGDVSFGGRSIDDGPAAGLGVFGWDSRDQAHEAYKKPEVASAWDKFNSFGKVTTILVKFQV